MCLSERVAVGRQTDDHLTSSAAGFTAYMPVDNVNDSDSNLDNLSNSFNSRKKAYSETNLECC